MSGEGAAWTFGRDISVRPGEAVSEPKILNSFALKCPNSDSDVDDTMTRSGPQLPMPLWVEPAEVTVTMEMLQCQVMRRRQKAPFHRDTLGQDRSHIIKWRSFSFYRCLLSL